MIGAPHGTWMDLRRPAFDATAHTDLGQGCQRIDGRFIEAVITGCFVHVQALVARRAVFAQLRFDETLRCSEDLDWAIRTVHEGGFTWAWSESVTGSYRLHPDSLAAQTPEKQEFIEKIVSFDSESRCFQNVEDVSMVNFRGQDISQVSCIITAV